MFERLSRSLCRAAWKRPWAWLAAALLVSLPAAWSATGVRLDTDLMRLLPLESRAVEFSRELATKVGDGGYFSMLYEGDDPEALRAAVDETAARLAAMPEIQAVEYQYPRDFIERYRYLLVPEPYLQRIHDLILEWEAEVNPMVLDLGPDDDAEPSATDDEALERLVRRYDELPLYHRSEDARVFGLIVLPRQGIASLGATRALHDRLVDLGRETAARHDAGMASFVGGSLAKKVAEYDQIIDDLKRSGLLAAIAIVAALWLSFRSVAVLPVVLTPLAAGLLWAFALVPWLVGELNTITSFILLVLFGTGVDYSIHLVKRFRSELVGAGAPDGVAGGAGAGPTRNEQTPGEEETPRDAVSPGEAALVETFRSTGMSVTTSALTTALALAILSVSEFRGFSDFGVIGGAAIVVVLLAMLTVMPATLAAGARLGLVTPRRPATLGLTPVPSRRATAAVGCAVAACAVLALGWLQFDYDFSNFSIEVPALDAAQERHGLVYTGRAAAPAAIYVADDLESLDSAIARLNAVDATFRDGPLIGRLSGIRDYVPSPAQLERRLELIADIQESLRGRWTRRVEDPDRRRWIEGLRDFVPPDAAPTVAELPPAMLRGLQARDGSGDLILGVDTGGYARNGRMAMAFTSTLYELDMPPGVQGPTGDKAVLAEILWLVTAEGPWLVALTMAGIFVLVLIDRGSPVQTGWVLLPLVAGMVLTLGGMVVLGWRLNFFNIVVLPTLLGLGVDHGVHYVRRWFELGNDTDGVQRELFEPLSACTVTTIMGYVGMVFAHHPGLRSIGLLAAFGLAMLWIAALVLLPGVLRLRQRQLERRQGPEVAAAEAGRSRS